MRLIHFSATPMVEIWPVPQLAHPDMKPKGLWLSDEDAFGWREWCTGERFGLDRLAFAHEIALAENANILRISDPDGIDELTLRLRAPDSLADGYRLKWAELAEEYHGILITPYIWERRLSMRCGWYYGWDCASGCIWDPEAIASFEAVELPPLPEWEQDELLEVQS